MTLALGFKPCRALDPKVERFIRIGHRQGSNPGSSDFFLHFFSPSYSMGGQITRWRKATSSCPSRLLRNSFVISPSPRSLHPCGPGGCTPVTKHPPSGYPGASQGVPDEGLVAIAVSGWPLESKQGLRKRISDVVAGYCCRREAFLFLVGFLWEWSGTARLAGLEIGRGGCVGGLNGSAFCALVMDYHSCW